ncbi:6-phosphogluconolactonase [Acidobacteria bacterium AH-259-O06]|nr:6-phosphogluconolactonase [Acidobacteria bacterium AH-259-O06]
MKNEWKEVLVCRDAQEVSRQAAELFVRLADEAIKSRARFTAVLSGGSTPKTLYSLLGSSPFTERVPWSRVYLFWGDERCVPPDHPESNYAMTRAAMLSKSVIPEENVYRIAAEQESAKCAALEYEQTIRTFFGLTQGERPRFDLILLGMGADGHTASLFPGTAALNETGRIVTANYVEKLKAHRITLTAPVINQAANVVFLVSGESKASVLKQVFEGPYEPVRLPSQLIRPDEGCLWLIVDLAASRLTSSLKAEV